MAPNPTPPPFSETQFVDASPSIEPQMAHNNGWIGVDLDMTLATYDHWRGSDHIGEPVPAMLAHVKKLLEEGEDVRIFTARVSPQAIIGHGDPTAEGQKDELTKVVTAIVMWCVKHVGRPLKITHSKDYSMKWCYDDRAIQMVPNEGRRADGLPL